MSLKHWWVWSACLLSKYSISNQPSQHFPFLRSNTFSSVFAKRQAVRHLEAPKAQHELPRHRGVLSPYSCQLPRGVRVCVIISPSTRLTGYDSARAKSELNARINELRGSWGQERGWREAPCLFGHLSCRRKVSNRRQWQGLRLRLLVAPFCCKFVVRLLNSIHLQSAPGSIAVLCAPYPGYGHCAVEVLVAQATHLSTQLSDPTCPHCAIK